LSLIAPFLSISPDGQIAEAVGELSANAFPRTLRAAVLTGSLARGEGTWLQSAAWNRLAGDAEFLLVFNEHAVLPSAEHLVRLKAAIRTRLCAVGIEAQIGLSAVRLSYLRRIRPHIFGYELITYGKVLWGDAHVLNLVPSFSSADIPLEDGFCLLVNRMIELLEALCESRAGEQPTDTVRYRALKLWLDMATSFLLFQGRYEPSYRARATRLAELASASVSGPFPLSRFAERVSVATAFKLGESHRFPVKQTADLISLTEDTHSLWRWELRRLTGSNPNASDDELLRRWIGDQEIIARMRGWASVAKRYGTSGSLASLLRWIRQALGGSPRRLLYGTASELFFALPALLGGAKCDSESCWNELRLQLPIMSGSEDASQTCAWHRLGRAIAWNYHQFLEFTRS
jgi:hypothetical protein